MRVVMSQRPVGQGGLFVGCLAFSGRKFLWVYDCGTDDNKVSNAALDLEIDDILMLGDIDVLFLSHLDSDHVSGVDSLSRKCIKNGHKIRKVVIPYMHDIDFIQAMAKDASNSSLSRRFSQITSDDDLAAEWGVESIIRIQSSDIERPELPIEDPDDDPDGITYWTIGSEGDILRSPRTEGRGGGITNPSWCFKNSSHLPIQKAGSTKIPTFDFESNAYLIFPICGYYALNFTLAPYAHKPSQKLIKQFENEIWNKFNTFSRKAISREALTIVGRKKLKECYDKIWSSNHNYVSMSLYCGPFVGRGCFFLIANQIFRVCRRGGWLLTGDSHLGVKVRESGFIQKYKKFIPKTCALMAPHHGANKYFGVNLLGLMKNLVICYSAAFTNRYPHPGLGVIFSVLCHPTASFHNVGNAGLSDIILFLRLRIVRLKLKYLRRFL